MYLLLTAQKTSNHSALDSQDSMCCHLSVCWMGSLLVLMTPAFLAEADLWTRPGLRLPCLLCLLTESSELGLTGLRSVSS